MRNDVVAIPALGLGVLASPLLLAQSDTPSLLGQKDAQFVVGRDAAPESPSVITNGDFEAGSLAPWNFTQLGKPSGVVVSLAPNGNLQARPDGTTGGNWHLRLSTNWHRPLLGTTKATVEQALQTQDGAGYRLSWSMMGVGGSKVSWAVGLGSAKNALASGVSGGDGRWHNYTAVFVGSVADVLVITAAASEEYGIAEWHYDDFAIQRI